jgi:hypothetical protein
MPKRFLLTLGLLTFGLFALVTGVNAALDRMSRTSTQNTVVIYDDQGNALYAYNGDLASCTVVLRPNATITGPHFLHRT